MLTLYTKKVIWIILLLLILSHKVFPGVSDERKKLKRFLQSIEVKTTGLYQSFTGTANWIEDVRFLEIPLMRTEKGYLDSQAFLYDNALVLIAMIDMEDYEKAEYMLHLFEDNFSLRKNNCLGLFNAYDVTMFDHYFYTKPGKYNQLVMGIDGDRIHIGPNIWVGLAAQFYYFRTRSLLFVDFVMKMFNWARDFTHYTLPQGERGAPSMGYGWGPDWQKVFSTENIIDYYAFLKNCLAMVNMKDNRVLAIMKKNDISFKDIEKEKLATQNWFKRIAWNQRGTFNRGGYGPTKVKGKWEYVVDTLEALDVNSWAICGIGPEDLDRMGIDPIELVRQAEDKFRVEVMVQGEKFWGFDFTIKEAYSQRRDQPMIWWEGTGQMALDYNMLADYAVGRSENRAAESFLKKYRFYVDEMNRYIDLITRSENNELPYVSHIIKDKQFVYAFNDWWPLARSSRIGNGLAGSFSEEKKYRFVFCISSTLWRYFAMIGLNPFDATVPRIE